MFIIHENLLADQCIRSLRKDPRKIPDIDPMNLQPIATVKSDDPTEALRLIQEHQSNFKLDEQVALFRFARTVSKGDILQNLDGKCWLVTDNVRTHYLEDFQLCIPEKPQLTLEGNLKTGDTILRHAILWQVNRIIAKKLSPRGKVTHSIVALEKASIESNQCLLDSLLEERNEQL